MNNEPDRHVRMPESLVLRADSLVEPVRAATLSAARWSTTAVIRLALEWGLDVLEAQLAAGVPLTPPAKPDPELMAEEARKATGRETVKIRRGAADDGAAD